MMLQYSYAYEFRDIFVGLPDARRRYIDMKGTVRRSNSEGGIFYRAYLSRPEDARDETFLEWCEKYDARGRGLKKNVIQRVHMPCVSKDWHVDRIAWYAILMHIPHDTRFSPDEQYGFVGLAHGLNVTLDGSPAGNVEQYVTNLEKWWLGLYQKWLTSIGQRAGWRSERTFEMAAQAFDVWRNKNLTRISKRGHVANNNFEPGFKKFASTENKPCEGPVCKHGRLPSCREEFERLGFEFNEQSCIVVLSQEINTILGELTSSDRKSEEQMAFVVSILNGLAKGEQIQYFLTGRAGTGKSFLFVLLKRVFEALGAKVLVLAPTALLARELGGYTVQSASGIGWGLRRTLGQKMLVLQAECDVVMLEEIGMVSLDDGEGCETAIREARTSCECVRHRIGTESWGGCHVIACGDFGQMKPPGVRALPFWTSTLWKRFQDHTFNLVTVHRAEEETLVELLDIVRDFQGIDDVRIERLRDILSRCVAERASTSEPRVEFCATHATARSYNEGRADMLRGNGEPFARYVAQDRLVACSQTNIRDIGLDQDVLRDVKSTLAKNHAAVETLDIFVGEKYILTSNSQYHTHIRNGTVVTIEGVEVESDGTAKCVYASSASWEGLKTISPSVIAEHGSSRKRVRIQVCEEVLVREGVRRNYYRAWRTGMSGRYVVAPVARKQFAMLMFGGGGTVHRFQGATLTNFALDCSDDIGMYCEGMIYVALSRGRRLEDICIRNVEDVIARIRSCPLGRAASRRGMELSVNFRERCFEYLSAFLKNLSES